MYEKMNITENHLKILSIFTRGFFREFYVREVQKLTKLSLGTTQKVLKDLEQKGALESETKGKIKVYRLRKNDFSIDYLRFAEDYKKLAFLSDKPLIREVLSKSLPFIDGIGLIFGSYAKGAQIKGSDLDIFVIGSYDREELKKISGAYRIEISVKSYPLSVFKKNLKSDHLIKEVLGNHILFLNGEQFIRMVIDCE